MYCYVVALVLLVTYSGSLGGPLPTSPLLNSLTALATSCGDPFLSSQITAQLDECTVTVPPYNEKQFECLIFYDINTQLCDAVASSKLSLSEDYTKKINEATEVEQVCTSAKQWNFLNLTDYPIYGATASKVFNNPITCVKICGVENVMSQDANFFCKYFKWGSEMLKNRVLAPSAVSSTAPVASNRPIPETQGKSQPEAVSASEDDIKVSPPMASNVGSVPNDTTKEAETIKAMDKLEEISKVEEVKPDPNPQVSTAKNLDIDDLEVNKYEKPSVDAPDAPTNVEASNDSLDKPSAAAVDPQKKEEEEVKDSDQTVKAQVPNPKEAVPDKNKIEDDYQDSEEGKEGLPEGSDDGDDPILGDLDTKSDTFTQTKGSKKIETPMSFVGEREFYPNTIPDGFADDDDHFFPFFLTAVILVVLLYVLYHNKSKVSKVFLGLIVEGRQSGRRRNSRGHAYRRLDTLEQAMSTNSSAPPSKIIY